MVRVLGRKFWSLCVAMVVGCAVCYVLGTIWFMTLTGADLASALGWCVLPYLPGDAVKIALAAILTIQLDKRTPTVPNRGKCHQVTLRAERSPCGVASPPLMPRYGLPPRGNCNVSRPCWSMIFYTIIPISDKMKGPNLYEMACR